MELGAKKIASQVSASGGMISETQVWLCQCNGLALSVLCGEDEDISAKQIFNQYPVTCPCLECTMRCDITIAKVVLYSIMFMHCQILTLGKLWSKDKYWICLCHKVAFDMLEGSFPCRVQSRTDATCRQWSSVQTRLRKYSLEWERETLKEDTITDTSCHSMVNSGYCLLLPAQLSMLYFSDKCSIQQRLSKKSFSGLQKFLSGGKFYPIMIF